MAKMYSTGPALLYTETGGGNVAFLGTCEAAPDIELTGEFEPIFNDLGGPRLPTDRIWAGEEAISSLVLTRWNEIVLQAIMGTLVQSGGVGGRSFLGDVGTIMGQEKQTFQFWILFPFASKAAYSDMPAGYHFLASMPIGPKGITPGTGVNKRHLILKHQRAMASTPPTTLNSTVFDLYDFNMSAVASIPID